jgi:hypothetical protein
VPIGSTAPFTSRLSPPTPGSLSLLSPRSDAYLTTESPITIGAAVPRPPPFSVRNRNACHYTTDAAAGGRRWRLVSRSYYSAAPASLPSKHSVVAHGPIHGYSLLPTSTSYLLPRSRWVEVEKDTFDAQRLPDRRFGAQILDRKTEEVYRRVGWWMDM